MEVRLANPRGFCAGVDRAILIVNRALEIYGAPVYVRHEVVHNRTVVAELGERGAIFVDELDDVPEGGLVIFSAHGVAKSVRDEAATRDLRVFDATCPLVTKVHLEVSRLDKQGRETILIGHAGHPEVEGTLGQHAAEDGGGKIHLVEDREQASRVVVKDPEQLSYVTQTTLSVDDTEEIIGVLKDRFPNMRGPRKDDICYATQNRQDAVKVLSQTSDVIFVVGSANSSNSNRLRELAERRGARAYLVDDASDIDSAWLEGASTVGVTSGASAPESLVQGVLGWLSDHGGEFLGEVGGPEEDIEFSLPRGLRRDLPQD